MPLRFDPDKRHRRSIRLKGYDYAQDGAYLATIVTQDRSILFGDIADGEMQPNAAGRMVQAVWDDLPVFYPGAHVDEFVLMPNHIHGIIVLVGAGPRACPGPGPRAFDQPRSTPDDPMDPTPGKPAGTRDEPGPGQAQGPAPTRPSTMATTIRPGATVAATIGPGMAVAGGSDGPAIPAAGTTGPGVTVPTMRGMSVGDVVHRFKSMTTKKYADGVRDSGWPAFRWRLWQRNYYEHVVRDDEALQHLRIYIRGNPSRWAEDEEKPADGIIVIAFTESVVEYAAIAWLEALGYAILHAPAIAGGKLFADRVDPKLAGG